MPLERPVGPILNGLPSQVPDTDPEVPGRIVAEVHRISEQILAQRS